MLVYHAVSSNVDVSPSAALERLGKYGMKHFVKHTVAQHWVSICQKGLANCMQQLWISRKALGFHSS